MKQIEEEEAVILAFWTRFLALQAFEKELIARTGASVFDIANTVVWDAMIGKRDLLVIHFASWVRGLCEPGGFFGHLRAHHVPELRKAFKATRNETPS